jgi:hypothetical protein
VAGEVALEEACCVAAALSFGYAAGDVVAGCRVVLGAVEDDGVECAVELAVAAAAEPVPSGLAATGRDRGDAGEAGEAGLRADPAGVCQATSN